LKDPTVSSRIARVILTALLASLGSGAFPADDSPTRYDRRWFYAMTNLQVKENSDRLIDQIERASKAGYNGVVLADYKLNVLDRVPDYYFANVARVQKAAQAAGVEIIPTVFPIGYSNGLLTHDPNLAEGLPVENAPFLVKGGEAKLVVDPAHGISNGELEEFDGDRFRKFDYQDEPGALTFADHAVTHRGRTSCRIEAAGPDGNRRLIQRVAVRSHACYKLSAWVKSRNLTIAGEFRLLAIGAGSPARTLTFFEGGVAPDQDWKRVEIVFNSLDNDAINVYAGIWGRGKGTLWLDGLAVEELGPVNVLRRPGCPLVVRSSDGGVTYEEGLDYEKMVDPKLGQVPYAGEFEFEHAPAPLRLTPRTRIKEGQRIAVSWYHPILTHGSQIMCCPSEPSTYVILRDQARRVNDLLHPKTFFMSHDEIRVMNWCRACQSRKLTPGQILADNVKQCVAILHEINPNAEAVVWSDMFDPNHNAVNTYYLVNGPLTGSWEGVPKEVVIANWNGGKKRPSLEFFAGRGHRQILAGYYDADDLSGFTSWDQAARGVTDVSGFMYTTWQAKFRLLEAYGQAMKKIP
jgi:hypothetical protein